MAKAKKEVVDVVETEVETTPEVEVATEESTAKKELRALIEAYKIQNPVKYELKKESLDKQLSELK